jgi:hypothetical protein
VHDHLRHKRFLGVNRSRISKDCHQHQPPYVTVSFALGVFNDTHNKAVSSSACLASLRSNAAMLREAGIVALPRTGMLVGLGVHWLDRSRTLHKSIHESILRDGGLWADSSLEVRQKPARVKRPRCRPRRCRLDLGPDPPEQTNGGAGVDSFRG